MPQNITVYLKDGSERTFQHRGRPGGSYTKTIRYEGNFAIVSDEYGNETAFPSENIDHVEKKEANW